ncbi:MAG: cupin [Mycobacterium sp.]|jgi:uncharacterized RmlC-like cupin family protein|nr:cupin [Mycobacterium sp.]MDT5313306.1 hypothetical protein [Mycobacterium sp.]
MADIDGFHPDFADAGVRKARNRVRHVKASELDANTAQSDGMQRFAALSGKTVGTEKLWMGETVAAETAIFIRSTQEAIVVNLPALYAL